MDYIHKLLRKPAYRAMQAEHASYLARRCNEILSTERRLVVSHGGWMPGCEPFFQVEELEWVELRRDLANGCAVSERWCYPDDPSDADIHAAAERLLR